jgi:hypothetical protein
MSAPASNALELRALDLAAASTPEAEAFLDRHPNSTVFYRPAWQRVLAETYGHRPTFYAAFDAGALVGLFPVVAVRHPLFGTKSVAQPYQFDSGAPLASSEAVARALVERALADARAARAHYFEIRHTAELPWLDELGFANVDSQLVTTVVQIDGGAGRGIELTDIRRGHRRNIQRALDAGLEIEETSGARDLARFRQLYLRENRDLAAPQAGWTYFEKTLEHLPDRLRLYLSHLGGRLVGGILTLDDGRTVFARCGAQNAPEARSIHLGKAQIFHTMQSAAARGCTRYNLGISWAGDTGLLANKEGWRGSTLPVRQYVCPIRKPAPAPGSYFEGYQLAKAVWRKLPLAVADWAGARITRWIC